MKRFFSLISLVLAVALFLFSFVIVTSHQTTTTECGGFTATTEYTSAFFPTYFPAVFTPNKDTSQTNSTLHKMLGCSVQPIKQYIPLDSIALFIVFVSLYLYLKPKNSSLHEHLAHETHHKVPEGQTPEVV